MRIIRAADRRVMPWKNGGGVTTEIAIGPDCASIEDFEWRVSTAEVATDGPFSRFPGIDRTLVVLDGAGIRLAFAEGELVTLDSASQPYAFQGDQPVTGLLAAGPIVDLNVMSRRGFWTHAMVRLNDASPHRLPAQAGLLVLVVPRGAWRVTSEGWSESLGAGDSAIFAADSSIEVVPLEPGDLYAITLRPVS